MRTFGYCPICKKPIIKFHLHCQRCGKVIEIGDNYYSIGEDEDIYGECCVARYVLEEPEPEDNADELYDAYIDRQLGVL